MIQIRSAVFRLLALMTAAIAFAACVERELCYDHSHKVPVTIEFDWTDASDAQPSTMVVWFFLVDGSQPHRFELIGDGVSSRGGFDAVVSVPEGTYRMVCHNGNTDFNVERGSGIDDYVITTDEVEVLSAMNRSESAPRPDDTIDQEVRSQASRLYAHTRDEHLTVVNDPRVSHKVVFRPSEKTLVCNVRITGVENLQPDVEVSALVTGVSEAWGCGSQSPSDVAVSVPFAFSHCGSDCLVGSVVVFGMTEQTHKLRVYTSYKYYYDFDITDQVRNQSGNREIDIVLSGIRLPEGSGSGSGMSPGVSDWGEPEEETLPM